MLETLTPEISDATMTTQTGRFFDIESEDPETLLDTEILSAAEIAKAARLAMEARQAEQRFYNQGLQDWIAMRRDTDAAKYYFDYWKNRR